MRNSRGHVCGDGTTMIEMAALLAMIERCAPDVPPKPLVAAAREASGFEPLVLATRQNGRVLTVQAMSRPEAIALASEMKVAGQPVRLGLLGIDAREFDRRGLPLGEAFDSCTNLRIAGELLTKNAGALTSAPKADARRRTPPSEPSQAAADEESPSAPSRPGQPIADPPRSKGWDVYGQAQANTALVYGNTR